MVLAVFLANAAAIILTALAIIRKFVCETSFHRVSFIAEIYLDSETEWKRVMFTVNPFKIIFFKTFSLDAIIASFKTQLENGTPNVFALK